MTVAEHADVQRAREDLDRLSPAEWQEMHAEALLSTAERGLVATIKLAATSTLASDGYAARRWHCRCRALRRRLLIAAPAGPGGSGAPTRH